MRSIYWVASDCTSRRQVAIQASDRCLVAFRLYVPVGVGRLADGRVPHLLLHPSEISAIREQPGCKGVARCVVLPVGRPDFLKLRSPRSPHQSVPFTGSTLSASAFKRSH
jgi:hypothetical protein